MKWPMWILPIALLLVVCAPMYSAEPDDGQEAAINAIEKLGGRVNVENNVATKVDLKGKRVTDDELDHLKGLTNLQGLTLVDTKVTDEGVKKLQQALPNCKIQQYTIGL